MKKLSTAFELIKKSVNIFSEKKNLIFFLKIYWPLIPFSGLSLVQQNLLKNNVFDFNSTWWLVATSIFQIAYVFVMFLVSIMGIIGVKKVLSGESLSSKQCYKEAKTKFWKYGVLSLVLGLIYLFGFAFLIIPGMLFVVWFVFARFIILDSNLKLKEVLSKSKQLVKGMYWKVLGRIIVFGLFCLSVEIIFGLVPFGLGVFITPLLGALYLLPSYLLYKEISG